MAYKDDPAKIDKTLLNYSAQAIGNSGLQYNRKHNSDNDINAFKCLISNSIKFNVSGSGGDLIQESKGYDLLSVGETTRLPFPIVAVEYYDPSLKIKHANPLTESPCFLGSIIVAVDLEKVVKTGNTWRSLKILSPELTKTPLDGILVMGFIKTMENGVVTWQPPSVGIIISNHWSENNDNNFRYFSLGGFGRYCFYRDTNSCNVDENDKLKTHLHASHISSFCAALSCNNVTTERFCSYPRALRRKNNKKKPIFEYHVLTIKPGKNQAGVAQGGTHASPRVHLRRGHRREYKPNSFTWVQPCVVGSKELGIVHKDYQII